MHAASSSIIARQSWKLSWPGSASTIIKVFTCLTRRTKGRYFTALGKLSSSTPLASAVETGCKRRPPPRCVVWATCAERYNASASSGRSSVGRLKNEIHSVLLAHLGLRLVSPRDRNINNELADDSTAWYRAPEADTTRPSHMSSNCQYVAESQNHSCKVVTAIK